MKDILVSGKDAPAKKMYEVEKDQGMVLAADIDYKDVDDRSGFSDGDAVIASSLLTPCIRNTWTLVPCDPAQKNKPIRFGDYLYIKLQGSDVPLYVEAPVPLPMTPRGECGNVVPKLSEFPSGLSRFLILQYSTQFSEFLHKRLAFFRFQVVHIYSSLRYETLGQIVPPFENIVLIHCASSEALAIEYDTWIPTYFGMECEVSVKNFFKDVKRPYKHQSRNFWRLMLSPVTDDKSK